MSKSTRSIEQLITAALEKLPENNYEAAALVDVSEGTIRNWRGGKIPKSIRADTRKLLEEIASSGEDGVVTPPLRRPSQGGRAPSLEQLEWLPRLIEKVIDLDGLSGAERQALIAELNAAGMRYWAMAAEWSAGQRGVAMAFDAEASGERAGALREAGRARTLLGRPVTEDELRQLEEIRAREARGDGDLEAGGSQR